MWLILTMPQPGETINEGVVVRWLKQPGESVAEKEPLLELETEKAVFNYESPFEGKLLSHEAKEGDSVPVGEPLAIFEVEESRAKNYLSLGIGRLAGQGPVQEKEAAAAPGQPAPRIRARARELGLTEPQLAKIKGSGPGGRITEEDLRKGQPTSAGGVKRVAVSPVRRRIAENMERSRSEIPHAAAAVEVDVTDLVTWKGEHEKSFAERNGIPLSFLPCFVWATVQGIRAVPEVNASWKGDIIEMYEDVHVNLAVATPKGLFVPLLKSAGSKGFVELAKESARLTAAAAAGTLKPEELAAGTITVNNHGAVGSVRAFQVIRHPQAAIIGFGKLVDRSWVVDGKIVLRKICQADVSFDHRLIDGDVAVKFLESVRKALEGLAAANPLG